MSSQGPKVLVSGASGFYGRHLLPCLRAQDYEIVAVSRRPAEFGAGVSTLKVSDIADEVDWPRYLDGVAAVVHLAGVAHATSFITEAEYDRVNRDATGRLARAAQSAGAIFIFMSSIAAQSGPSAEHVLAESDDPMPTTAYGRSKLRAEQQVAEAGDRYVIFRPTLTYGEGVLGNMGRLIQLATSRVPLPVGSLHNRRSLLAVENACEAICFALTNDRVLGNTFLLADRHPLSIAEMVRALREGAGMGGGGVRVPPALLSLTLRSLGRADMWDKLAGDLIVSVEKLSRFGFRWKVDTGEGLRALGASYGRQK